MQQPFVAKNTMCSEIDHLQQNHFQQNRPIAKLSIDVLLQMVAASGLFRCKWVLQVVAASGFAANSLNLWGPQKRVAANRFAASAHTQND